MPLFHLEPHRRTSLTSSELTEAKIDAASSGNNTLVAATAGQIIRVYRIFFVLAGNVNYKFIDGVTDLTPAMTGLTGGSFVLDYSPEPWLVTTAGNALILNLDGAVQVSGRISYIKS